jgi:hypothetical protein
MKVSRPESSVTTVVTAGPAIVVVDDATVVFDTDSLWRSARSPTPT